MGQGVYEGRVVNITKFGAFVNILPGRDGLVHISKLGGGKRIDRVEDVLALGDAIEVEVEDIAPMQRTKLNIRSIIQPQPATLRLFLRHFEAILTPPSRSASNQNGRLIRL